MLSPQESQDLNRAMQALQQGQFAQAQAQLNQLKKRYPKQAEVYHLLAVVALQDNRSEEAEPLFQQALEMAPEAAHIYNNYANFLLQQERFEPARKAYQKALAYQPNHYEAHTNLARLLLESQPQQALKHLKQSLRINPQQGPAAFELGRLALRLQEKQLAVQGLQLALQLGFEAYESAFLLAQLAYDDYQFDVAQHWLSIALKTPAPQAEYLNLQGLLCYQLKQYDRAQAAWDQALALSPTIHQYLMNRASVDFARKDYAQARQFLNRALAQAPDHPDILENLANCCRMELDYPAARAYLEQAHQLRPEPKLTYRLGLLLPSLYASQQEIQACRERLEAQLAAWECEPPALKDPNSEVGETLFLSAYHGFEDTSLMQKMNAIYRKACPDLTYTAPHCQKPRTHKEKLKIAFVSTSFWSHTVSRLFRGCLAHWPRDRFETHLCFFNPPEDQMAQWIAQQTDQVHILPPGLFPARQKLSELAFDIIFYPDILQHSLIYFLSFARLAPIQCTTWGHGITSGVSTVDLFFSSPALEGKPGQAAYSEKLVLTDALFPYYYPLDTQPGTLNCKLPEGHLYGCLQNLTKLHPDMDPIFKGILQGDPEGYILLLGHADSPGSQFLKQRFQAYMGEDLAQRIVFVPPHPLPGYFELLRRCKVQLDPLHFGGGNTTYEALLLGSPVICWPGEFLKSRITYALYQSLDYTELCVDSAEAYIHLALQLATDVDRHASVVQTLQERSPRLLENTQGTREMADYLWDAWHQQCNT